MYDLYNVGKDEYAWAQEFKEHNIQGSFTSILAQGKMTQSAARLAYFSGNNYYFSKEPKINESELIDEMNHYGIQYFFVYTYPGNGTFSIPKGFNANGKRITETDIGETNEIKVFKIN